MDWKKLALIAVLNKAKKLHKEGNTVEQIAEKFWAEPKVAEGLMILDLTTEDLIKMIKDAVRERNPWWKRLLRIKDKVEEK